MAAVASSNKRLIVLVLMALGLWFFKDRFDPSPSPAKPAAAKLGRGEAPTNASTARPVRSNPPDDVCTVPTELPRRVDLQAKAKANPFVEPPPPPPKPVRALPAMAAAPVVVPSVPAEPPPPRLPYTYIGQFVDPGHPTVVFLSSGNTLIHVSPGDTLDGSFKLESIGPRELVFVHVQRNVTLRIPIEGERL